MTTDPKTTTKTMLKFEKVGISFEEKKKSYRSGTLGYEETRYDNTTGEATSSYIQETGERSSVYGRERERL